MNPRKASDSASLAERIIELLQAPAKAQDYGDRLRQVAVTDYDWMRAGEVLLDVYDRATERRRAAARTVA